MSTVFWAVTRHSPSQQYRACSYFFFVFCSVVVSNCSSIQCFFLFVISLPVRQLPPIFILVLILSLMLFLALSSSLRSCFVFVVYFSASSSLSFLHLLILFIIHFLLRSHLLFPVLLLLFLVLLISSFIAAFAWRN